MDKTVKLYLMVLSIGFSLSILFNLYLFSEMRTLMCDAQQSVFAEREYTYPLLERLGNPDEVNKELKNPLTTKKRYSFCVM